MTQLALVIDLYVCVGCHACVTSCKEWNTSGAARFMSDDNPYDRDPTGTFFNRVQTFEVGEFPNTQTGNHGIEKHGLKEFCQLCGESIRDTCFAFLNERRQPFKIQAGVPQLLVA